MPRILLVAVLLLLAALYIYFLGTPLLSRLTGISPRAISLTSGFAVVLLGIVSMMLGRLAAQAGRPKKPDIDSRP